MTSDARAGNVDPARDPQTREVGFDQVRAAVKAVRHGEVRVIIQDGLIVQIDRVEKQRLR